MDRRIGVSIFGNFVTKSWSWTPTKRKTEVTLEGQAHLTITLSHTSFGFTGNILCILVANIAPAPPFAFPVWTEPSDRGEPSGMDHPFRKVCKATREAWFDHPFSVVKEIEKEQQRRDQEEEEKKQLDIDRNAYQRWWHFCGNPPFLGEFTNRPICKDINVMGGIIIMGTGWRKVSRGAWNSQSCPWNKRVSWFIITKGTPRVPMIITRIDSNYPWDVCCSCFSCCFANLSEWVLKINDKAWEAWSKEDVLPVKSRMNERV